MAEALLAALVTIGIAQIGVLIRITYALGQNTARVEILERALLNHLEKQQ